MSRQSLNSSAQVSSQPDAIERSRTYRAPPPPLALQCNLIKAVTRPDHGTRGDPVNLLINWFRMHFKKMRIYVYKVSMVEEQPPQRGRRGPPKPPSPITQSGIVTKIFWKTVRSYRENFLKLHEIVFDDFEYAFTPQQFRGMDKGARLSCEHPEREGIRVTVKFECHDLFDLDLRGDINSNRSVQWTSIYLKNLLSQNTRYVPGEDATLRELEMSQRFAHVDGGLFFVPRLPNSPKVVVQPGVQAWLGLYASVRRMENFDPVINFGLVNKLFVEMSLDLITFYIAIENDSLSGETLRNLGLNSSSCMGPRQADNFNHKLKDLNLKCDCVPGKDKDDLVTGRVERHYRFVKLKEDTSADREFLMVEDNRAPKKVLKEFRRRDGSTGKVLRNWSKVRMDKWYADQGKPLKYPKLPLCEVKTGKKIDLVPMEMLTTHDRPHKYIKLLNFYARMRICKLLARTPVQHCKYTNKMINEKLEYAEDPFMKAVNISIDSKMIECEGRRMEPCAVLGKSKTGDEVIKLEKNKETGQFTIHRSMETSVKTIRFIVFKLTDAISKDYIREFYQVLVKKCDNRGFIIPESDHLKPPYFNDVKIVGDRQLSKLIEDSLVAFDKFKKSEDEIPVFIFFTKMIDELYGEIKYLCDIQYGVVSQVVDESSVNKASTKSDDETKSDYKSIYHHICLKLNAKLGGMNQILAEPDEPEYGRMPSHEKTMFVGIDVIHPSPNSPIRDCSLAAIVASMDKNAAKYAVRIKVNSRCNENVQLFDQHFSAILQKYHALNGFPDRIVVLRDGVSDSEMIKVASQEIHSIKHAWEMCWTGKKCPPFTYIVVQKSHKTRFYRRPEEAKGDVSNPPMGTVVDKEVVTPHMFDFYLVSHFTELGTTRPIHYTVVYDECESSADSIQEMVFRLCFLYARCSKPVSLPAPVYYAHLACTRAALQHEYAIKVGVIREIFDKGATETVDEYANRLNQAAMDIEKELQVSRSHPGMYFI